MHEQGINAPTHLQTVNGLVICAPRAEGEPGLPPVDLRPLALPIHLLYRLPCGRTPRVAEMTRDDPHRAACADARSLSIIIPEEPSGDHTAPILASSTPCTLLTTLYTSDRHRGAP